MPFKKMKKGKKMNFDPDNMIGMGSKINLDFPKPRKSKDGQIF